jgi:predicted DNA-binding transcriptional regulator AlpA
MSLTDPQPQFDDGVLYLSAEDLARRYSCHTLTIYRWAREGTLPKGELIARNSRRWRSDELAVFEALRRGLIPDTTNVQRSKSGWVTRRQRAAAKVKRRKSQAAK